MASGEWGAARAIWEQVLQQDPENTIARVELATCVENLGDVREALKVLDTMRASNHMNAAVLFKAVELNRKLGNNTAAKDNLALLVQEAPTKRALELARNIAEELGRIDDAEDRGGVEHGRVVREQRAYQLGRHVGVRCLHPPRCCAWHSTEGDAQRRVE
jgi:thioredoxin-like negative regulator of GroEL